jgi:phosphonoacetate hydrolase
MNMQSRVGGTVVANGRSYRFPKEPTVVVCIDGSEPGYIERAIEAGLAPNLDRLMKTGANLLAASVIPSFTNPNNISIITGRPPAVHGIAGNYFFDPSTGEEVMMNDARFMRTDTIMKAFHDAGAKVAVVTAKDKLRTLLGYGLDMSVGTGDRLLVRKGRQGEPGGERHRERARLRRHAAADVYSAELSEFVFAAGVKLCAVPAGRDVPLHDRLHPAQGCPGLRDCQPLLRHA